MDYQEKLSKLQCAYPNMQPKPFFEALSEEVEKGLSVEKKSCTCIEGQVRRDVTRQVCHDTAGNSILQMQQDTSHFHLFKVH